MPTRASSPPLLQIATPFPVLVNANGVVPYPGWIAAVDAVRAGLDAETPVVLAGAPGAGKSLLLRVLKRDLEREGQAVLLLPGSDPASPSRVVLIDEADRIPPALLRGLVDRAPQCVLAGSRKLLEVLSGSGVQSVLVEMRPLSLGDVKPYLQTQVENAGLDDTLLGPDTLAALARFGGGNPRTLQTLANRALFHARMAGTDVVSAAHVALAAAQDGTESVDAQDGDLPFRDVDAPATTLPLPLPVPVLMPPRAPPARLGRSVAVRSLARPFVLLPGVVCCLALLAFVTLRDRPPASVVVLPPPAVVQTTLHPDLAPGPPGPAPTPDTVAEIPVPAPPPPPDLATASVPAPPVEPRPAATAVALRRPATIPVHVTVAFARSDAAAQSRAVAMVGALQEAGMETSLSVGPRPGRHEPVSYFYANDQAPPPPWPARLAKPGASGWSWPPARHPVPAPYAS